MPTLPCIFYQFTGLYCPGCGATRSTLALIDGDIASAFSFNVLFPPLAVLLAFVGIWVLAAKAGKVRSPWQSKRLEKTLIAVGITLVAFGVLRNLPWFEFLAPAAS